ncbi:ankyrin repeat-containing domain protein [Trichoderma pleuroticola]
MPEGARSDAPVPPKLDESGIEDTASAITVASDAHWLALIQKEAFALLDLIRSKVDRGRILLVVYGFGGIVIKRAIVLANTFSQYYDIAFQVYRLVFFSTPHRDGEKKEWGRVIKDMMQVTDAKFLGGLLEILFELFRSSSQISRDFHKFAVKYPIANFIERPDISAAKPIMDEGELANDIAHVESGQAKEFRNLTLHEIATLDHLETLRTLFGLKQTCSNGLTSSQQDYGGICDYKYLLHRSALDNRLDAFMTLLRLSENDSEANDEGMTPLHMAAAGGSTSMVSLLLDKCTMEHEPINRESFSPLDKQDNKLRTPLIMAASMGHEEATKLLFQSRANVSMRDDTRKTVLHYGALNSLVAVEDFISSDLARLRDNDGCTALHIAASSGNLIRLFVFEPNESLCIQMLLTASEAGNLEIVLHLLIEKRVNPSSEWKGRLPICQAAVGGHLEVVYAFLLRGEDSVRQRDRGGKTALHCACDVGMHDMAKTLLLYHSDVDTQDCNGETPLHIAMRKGRIDVINLLLEFKVNIHARSKKEETPLHMAVAHPEAVEALLKAGADPNSVDKERQTPLHCAARQECWQSVTRLFNHGANPHQLDSEQRSPLYYATANDHLAIVEKFLQDHDASVDLSAMMSRAIKHATFTIFAHFMRLVQTTVNNFHMFKANLLHDAAVGGSIGILDLLLQSGVDANLRRYGSSALYSAAQHGCVYHVQKLIDFKAKVDPRDDNNRTPLHYAAEKNDYEAVKALLDAGSEINAQDNDLVTPIYLASQFMSHKAIQELIKHKADMNIATLSQGWTPLHASIDGGHSWATELLLDAGADPNLLLRKNTGAVKTLLDKGADPAMTTKKGDTALHLACSDCNVEMLQLLIKHGADIDLWSSEGLSTLTLATMTRNVEKLNLLLSTDITSREDPKWQLDDLIPAYRRAITLYCQDIAGNQEKEASKCLDIIKALLEKEPKLRGTESGTELDMETLNDLRMRLFECGSGHN